MVITLTGDDSYALKAEQRRIVGDFIKEHGDLGLERLDAEEASIEQILDAINSASLLSGAKLVVVSAASKHKDLLERFETLGSSIPDTTTVLVVDSVFDKRAKYYKILQKHTDFREFSSAKDKDLAGWVVKTAIEQGGNISRADAVYLVNRVGSNKLLLANEIEKLLLFDSNITKATIDTLSEPTPQSSVFQLLDAAFAGDHQKAAELYEDQRKQRVEPLAIMAMVTWQLHILALLKTAGERSIDEVAKEAKVNPFVLRKSQTVARKLSLAQLKSLIHKTLDLDVRLKRETIDADEAMHELLLAMN